MSLNAFVTLNTDGVSVVVDLTDGRLPALLHWGPDLGELTIDDVRAMALTAAMPAAPSTVDEPSRLALLPEHWAGWTGRPGLSGARADGSGWSPKFVTHTLLVDGEQQTDAELITLGTAAIEVLARDEEAGLELALTLELTAGGVLRTQARLTNVGDDDYRLDDLVIAYPVPTVASELQDQAGRWAKERVPQRRDFSVGAHVREGRHGRTGADAATVLHAGTPSFSFADGEVWGVHVGWSGNHTHYAERIYTGEQVIGGGELLLPGEVVLAPGGDYTSPWLYGSYGRGLDEVARRFHRYLRSRPNHPTSVRPVTINVWEAVYFDHTLQPLLDLAEKAAAVGVERYVLDDGWFGARRDDFAGLGDWVVADDVWPDGLHPLVDRVKELGMQFGLWFEPEMINEDSDVARAHPEWIMATGDRLPVESRHQQVINLGIPECYAHVRDQMLAILDEYDIGYIKWDHNRDLIDAGNRTTGRAGVHAQTEAVYRLIDELKAAHPGLEIESCSSGGARVDLGILQRTDRVWVSDCIDPLERQQMMRWTQQLLPPELLGSHIASGTSHTTGRTHELNFRGATALFGHLGIEWDLRNASDGELDELAEWVEFHKEHRDLLHGGDLVRVDFPDDSLVASGVVSPDRSSALYSFASVSTHVTGLRGRLRMPGLDPDRRYRVSPVLVGRVPSGLRPAKWWGVERDLSTETVDLTAGRPPRLVPVAEEAGVVLPGRVLGSVGVMESLMFPDHALLYLVEAVD
ncbi:alpha-galactosidase [Tessaracoccus flavus]|uniref:Alpha-galactosidase n=1 Tax=Tessaracoccus flavus TaxID=1610493 RepID=A0A1Q2CHR2_9ACTN|nr:alpha-galactosidase [Tessaracoccus flavus]AQP45659.1 alpha-galactosidase [Tessaracoccus flavus]SDY75928.1 alpha-galactosidase [Tessaracoccus flavus]